MSYTENTGYDDELEILDLDEDINYDTETIDTDEIGEEYYEDEVYEDEVYEDDVYEDEVYEDEVYEDEYYEDEVYEDEYYEEDVAVPFVVDEDIVYEDIRGENPIADEYDDAEEAFDRKGARESRKKEHNGAKVGLLAKIMQMDTMDKIIMSMGCLVLVLAIVAVSIFASYRAGENQLMAFMDMGSNIDDITLIGESGLLAVTDSTVAKIDALNEQLEEEEEEEEEDNQRTNIVVQLNFTSIQKDLKIKFTNKKSGKLIAGIPFEVEVKYPSGSQETWCDEDKDGIIYYKNIASGDYYVTIKELEGEIYERYILDTTAKKTTVKKEIVYTQVDVSDEILDESEIDASKEDTELGNTVESALTDTVAWVPYNVEPAGKNYVEVDKSEIVAPAATAKAVIHVLANKGMIAMTSAEIPELSVITENGNGTGSGNGTETTPEVTVKVTLDKTTASVNVGETVKLTVTEGTSVTWSSDNTAASVGTDGTVTGVSAGTANITATSTENPEVKATCVVTVTEPTPTITVKLDKTEASLEVGKNITLTATEGAPVKWSSDKAEVATVDSNGKVTAVAEGTAIITATSEADANVKATCTITVTAVVEETVTLDKENATIEIDETVQLKVTEGTKVTWSSSNDKVATVDENGVVTGIEAGKVTITATSQLDTNINDTCVITVTVKSTDITLDKEEATMYVGDELVLKATTVPEKDVTITWKTSDEKLATVKDGKVTALKQGEVTITATVTNGEETEEATCKVTIKEATYLQTKDGLDVYVMDGDKYVKAKAEDYAKKDAVFYVYKETYKYQGWQTFDGKTYYYDINYTKVTGEQVIMGAKYVFDSNGVLTSNTGIMGIDVSKWNGTIDWKAVKASGVSYVIIRCGYRGSSQGSLIEDPKYKANIKGATEAGLKVGVYFFSQAIDEVEAVQEASMVLSLVKGYKISYPIFLDVEASGGRADNLSKETRTAVCKAFCQTIQNAGYTAGVYANRTWLTNKIDTSQLGSYKIWLAQYAAKPTYAGRYEMWQYKDSGSIPGISGHVDLNLSYLGY